MGNQMFQYALYRAYVALGTEAKLDRAKFTHFDEKRDCILDYNCFNLDYEVCTKSEARKYVIGTGMVARIISRYIGDKKTHYREKMEFHYEPDILKLKDGFIDGSWQTSKYFEHIQDDIKSQFRFLNQLTGSAKKYEDNIKMTNSVAVHIRRGDYLKHPEIYGNICTEDYYKIAILRIYDIIDNPVFYFFSNDIEWTKKTFGDKENYIYVEGSDEKNGYIDMQLMSECKHQIIANSSFSWWAAYLNSNPDKKVICPSKWVNNKETPDIYCKNWVKIDG
jgi:hypothetical protein